MPTDPLYDQEHPLHKGRGPNVSFGGWAAKLVTGVLTLVLVLLGFYSVSTNSVQQDSVGFTVGGGPFDGARNRVKSDLLQPGRHIHGTLDTMWQFPAYRAIRFQDYEVAVTTRDGKQTNLVGQLGFRFIGEKNPQLAREFATGLGSRKYDGMRPGDEGGDGWTAFLDTMVVPEINAAAKQSFGNAYCADFEPSCRVIDPRSNVPDTNPDRIYDPMAKVIEDRVARKLGGRYLVDFRFTVRRIELTKEVQDNINSLGAEQAATKAAEQSQRTALARAKAIRTLGRALQENRSLVGVEIVKECKGKCTVILDGTGRVNGTSVPAR